MIKKYLIDLVVGSLLVVVLVQTLYIGPHPYEDISFVIGLTMFSVGLLTVSGAAKIFRGMGYVMKKIFTKKVDELSFYDYLLTREEKTEKIMGYPLLLAGITFIILSLTLAEKISELI
jgi:hypothetical protein